MSETTSSISDLNRLSARIAGFVAHLRLNDFHLGPRETASAVDLLAAAPLPSMDEARLKLKILLASRREEWRRFDDLFEAYWLVRGRERQAAQPAGGATARDRGPEQALWGRHLDSAAADHGPAAVAGEGEGEQNLQGDAAGRLVASARHATMKTDLRAIADPRAIAQAERLAYDLARAMRYRLSRRYRRSARGTRLDLRRTIRASLSRGGEPLTLVRKERPDRPVRIVVFLDVSGSMKAYSRFFLQFVKGLVCEWIDTDAYLFHTRLIRVTDALRERDATKAMTSLSLMAEGFGGGTKLGASLRTFNDAYAKRALNSRSVVIILSDGYDTGPADRLAHELARLKRRAPRLVWLNPLLGWRDYEPVTAAMAAALPFVDHFAAANTLESLAAIEPDLARL